MARDEMQKRESARCALHESHAWQDAIFASPLIGILTLSENGRIESLNPLAARMFGWRPGAAVRHDLGRLVDLGGADEIGTAAKLRALVTADGDVCELIARRQDGSNFPIDFALAEMQIGTRRMFVVFVRDISRRKRSERLKEEFVATVSHELRTPLTSIAGSLGLLAGGAAGELPAAAARLLEIARNNSQRLVRLINDVLDRPAAGSNAHLMPVLSRVRGRPRILHVDDDRDVLHVVAETLRADADIVSARSIKAARRALAEGDVDLALIDVALADGLGLDLLPDLRNADGSVIPAVVFSGQEPGPDIARRVDAVLTKSGASLERLVGMLRRMARSRAPDAKSSDQVPGRAAPHMEVA